MSRQLTTIELFAGIAGFSSPHTRPVAFVEKDANCRAVLRRHYPGVLILEDVTTAGAHNLPHANILKMGFPCQDLSVAGNRAGLSGVRSGLFYEGTRITHELRIDYLVWENVPGLLSSGAGRDFLSVLIELDRIGLAGGWTTVDAQFFGVAQRRCRVFGVFARRDIGAARCAEILSLAARLPWNLTPGHKTRKNTPARAGTSFKKRGGFGWSESTGVTATLESEGGTHQGGPERVPLTIAHTLTANYGKQIDSSDTNHGPPNLIYAFAQNTRDEVRLIGGDGQIVGALGAEPGMHQQAYVAYGGSSRERSGNASLTAHPGNRYDFDSETLVCGALSAAHGGADDNDAQAGHLIAGTLGAEHGRNRRLGNENEVDFVTPTSFGVRRLTPRECERLQGFPDDYTAWGVDERGNRVEMADSTRYRMLGNAICRKVSAWIDGRIVHHDQH